MTALEMLKYMHYQICNGGFEQACGNGYVDDLLDEFGTAHKWIKQLKEELDMRTKEGEEAIKAAEMISLAIGDTDLITSCQDCDGEGTYMEDDYEETCELCDGDGFLSVDSYSDVSFDSDYGFNDWADDWDSKYYDTIDSDIIDDLTGQSHTHSVVLDMLKKESLQRYKGEKEMLCEKLYNYEDSSDSLDNEPFNDVIMDIARRLRADKRVDVHFYEGSYVGGYVGGLGWDYEWSEINIKSPDDDKKYNIKLDREDCGEVWPIYLQCDDGNSWDIGDIISDFDEDQTILINIKCDIDEVVKKIYNIIFDREYVELADNISKIVDEFELEETLKDIIQKYDKENVISMLIAKIIKDNQIDFETIYKKINQFTKMV